LHWGLVMKNTYGPALMLVAVVLPVPILATFITVILYIILQQQFGLTDWPNWMALLCGFILTLIIWFICAAFCRKSATSRYANNLSYDAIMQEFRRLEVNYQTIQVNEPEETFEPEEAVEVGVTAQTVKVAESDEWAVPAQIAGLVPTDEMSASVQSLGAAGTVQSNGATEPAQDDSNSGALERAYEALYGEEPGETIEESLQVNGMQWVRGTGYINIWNRLQAADQEMIALLPKETVDADADYDLLRLDGSTIPNSQHWIDTINQAKASLEKVDTQKKAKKSKQDHTQQSAKEQQLLSQALLDLIKATVSARKLPLDEDNIPKSFGPALFSILKSAFTDPPPASEQTEEQARAALRQARIAINTYITNRWVGLIQSRNRLIETSFFASILVYLLFIIAIIGKAPADSLIAGLVFYFVGAVAGLFPRLAPKMSVSSQPSKTKKNSKASSQSATTTGQSNGSKANGNGKSANQNGSAQSSTSSKDSSPPSDDYGLTMARILVTPVFSGLAALIGVGVATMLSITLVSLTPMQSSASSSTPTPTAIVAPATPTAAVSSVTTPTNRIVPNYPSLDQVYSLSTNVQGVIFAVIFGFLPSFLIGGLQKEATLMLGQLASTDPGEDGDG
jgi:hypothetical protein